ncbi:uncharacterized protein LOC105435527 [Cucumis sativus]|uniref:uncharacterized protein LOC105435527 n=1 Tax=Cucumis sativus TaxID=3659 RepID=UPI0012F4DE6A|nr:uncharacterized protein LOC105435527 [Cucumis sativus]KAE8648564.1 hypothetical protein Csa_009116 [Cucumis sativus]
MKHSSTRNVIERVIGLLKGRWVILREKSYYPIQVQCRTIMACCLLHNLINCEMTNVDTLDENEDEGDSNYATTGGDHINYIEASNEWTQWRDDLAQSMFNEWQSRNDYMASSSRNPKHAWTRAEESCLVSCLVDLVSVEGWRSDNDTFRPSYLAQLLRMLAERMPGCKLTSTTVVESRIKLLKRSFQAIAEMCGPVCSGFGWNDDL